jgi:nitrate reductase alpha subunit
MVNFRMYRDREEMRLRTRGRRRQPRMVKTQPSRKGSANSKRDYKNIMITPKVLVWWITTGQGCRKEYRKAEQMNDKCQNRVRAEVL